MSGLYATRRSESAGAEPLAAQLRRLREESGEPGWRVGAAAEMDSTLLSKIENGRRRPTAAQLAALAQFYGVDAGRLESLRLAEEIMEKYGASPELAAAGAILQEEAQGG